jgi:type IV secretory pathway VirB3-like protein
MTTPTYRSVNQTATLLGIDRRLCIVILIVAFLVFRHFTVSSALAAFALLWSGAYWVTKHDPELVVIVPKAFGQRSVYDPGKTTNERKGRFPARFARSIKEKGGLL